jgi:hypothetical protein
MQGYQPSPPDASDIPFGFVESDGVHKKSWQETFQADEPTLWARAWSSDLLAAFRTAKAYFAREYGEKLRETYGDEWAMILDRSFEVYAALIDAAGKADEHKAKVRRFPLAAWEAQAHLSRVSIPSGLDPADFKRFTNTLARGWRRYGWNWVHKLQLLTGVALFERESTGFQRNHDATPASYTDHFTDLLIATIRKARLSRSRRVDKFERAFEQCFKEFREQKLIPEYAPESRKTEEKAARAKVKADAQKMEQEPTVQVEGIARRATAKAAKIVADLPGDEALAVDIALVEWITDEWKKATGRVLPFPSPLPVIKEADTNFSDVPETASSCASPQEAKRDFGAENEETPSQSTDNMSYETPPGEVLEYDPEPEPRGISLADAEAAADVCASVGVSHVLVVWTDDTLSPEENNCTGTDRFESVAEFKENLPSLLNRNDRSPVESMAVRIRWMGETHILQIDECSPEVLAVLAPYAFMQLATSFDNGQAWLAFSEGLTDEQYDELKSRLFTRLNPTKDKKGANGGAHGSVRWPGSLNRKPKRRYADGESPRVKLLRTQAGRTTSIAELEAAGLLAPAPQKPSQEEARVIRGRFPGINEWPNMGYYLAKHGSDRSRAESAWCVRALGMGHPCASVEAELIRIGEKASVRRRDNYARDTVDNAARYLNLNSTSSIGGAA